MLRKTINYTDFNGVKRTEDFYFHLSKAELMELELGTTGGLGSMIKQIVATDDRPTLVKLFKDIILKAYGEKSLDGKRFMKESDTGVKLSLAFSQTEAYSILFTELATDADAASNFIKGIIPSDMEIPDTELPTNN